MRRKYDLRNKRNFIIILILSLFIVGIFSLFIYKYKHTSKLQYVLASETVIQDIDKNYLNLTEDGILKVRWNDNYYVEYQNNKMNLGKNVIAYNTLTGEMNLYGKVYLIKEDGGVETLKGETKLPNTTEPRFYKLGDREYLLVDRVIASDDRKIETNNYLLVELDKLGNAKLSNNKLQLKTISPTMLVTSKYSFDIANEILKFGNTEIDLRKIIGSSNEYTKKEESKDKDDDINISNGGNGHGNGSNGTSSGNSGGGISSGNGFNGNVSPGDVINNSGSGTVTNIEEIKNKTKMTSVVRVSEELTQIDIDYVIFDPYNEYKSIYAEILKNGSIDVVYLSKNDTHLVIDNLIPDTEYKVNFIYTTEDSELGEVVPNTFDSMTLRTKAPIYTISIYKISVINNSLTYKVNLQEGYNINKAKVKLAFKYNDIDVDTGVSNVKEKTLTDEIAINYGDKYVTGTFNLSGYDINKDNLLKLEIVSVTSSSKTINVNSAYTFKFGR